jgi:hypothetical protein
MVLVFMAAMTWPLQLYYDATDATSTPTLGVYWVLEVTESDLHRKSGEPLCTVGMSYTFCWLVLPQGFAKPGCLIQCYCCCIGVVVAMLCCGRACMPCKQRMFVVNGAHAD